jgi:hypothetical protein
MHKRQRELSEAEAMEEAERRVKRLALGPRAPSPLAEGDASSAAGNGEENERGLGAKTLSDIPWMSRGSSGSLASLESDSVYRRQAERLRLLHFERLVRASATGENAGAAAAATPSERR